MRVLDNAIYVEANHMNFSSSARKKEAVRYVVCHYTGNINDTARNNAVYFRDNAVQSSAHFFVSDITIYKSVPLNHAAYAIGLGARKQPYFKWPSMWKKITNSNSISIEMCGSKNSREASDKTKETAAALVADILDIYGLTPSAVYRHYDVTGKCCPAWAVTEPFNWIDFMLKVNNYYCGEGDKMKDSQENYNLFKTWMKRYEDEKAAESAGWANDAMTYCQSCGLINEGRPNSYVTRAELATVIMRMNG